MDLPQPEEPRRLAPGERAESVVIGAGFTGLAVARRLGEIAGGRRVVLLEAQRAGWGASGRSSGFVVSVAHFVARMPSAAASAYVRVAEAGIRSLEDLVSRHAIDCDWDDRGWLHAAAGDAGARSLVGLQAWLAGRQEPFEALDRDGMEAVTGTRFYRAGIRLPGSVLVHAGALVRGLATHLPESVELFEETPVRSIRRAGSGWLVEAGAGTVETDRLFLATNGYSAAVGFLRRRVLPLYTFASMTRPLEDGEREALGGEGEWGLLAEDPMGSTLRRTRDQRILIRNTVRFRRGPMSRRTDIAVRRVHRRALTARFPALERVPFEHTWAGLMGVTPDRTTYFGRIAPGLYAAAGYTGAGIALGTAAGGLLAEVAAGSESDLLADMESLPEPSRLPPAPFLDLGARFKVWRMNASADPAV